MLCACRFCSQKKFTALPPRRCILITKKKKTMFLNACGKVSSALYYNKVERVLPHTAPCCQVLLEVEVSAEFGAADKHEAADGLTFLLWISGAPECSRWFCQVSHQIRLMQRTNNTSVNTWGQCAALFWCIFFFLRDIALSSPKRCLRSCSALGFDRSWPRSHLPSRQLFLGLSPSSLCVHPSPPSAPWPLKHHPPISPQ